MGLFPAGSVPWACFFFFSIVLHFSVLENCGLVQGQETTKGTCLRKDCLQTNPCRSRGLRGWALPTLNHYGILETVTIILPSAMASSLQERALSGELSQWITEILKVLNLMRDRVGGMHGDTCAKIFVAVIKLASRSSGPHILKVSFPACNL